LGFSWWTAGFLGCTDCETALVDWAEVTGTDSLVSLAEGVATGLATGGRPTAEGVCLGRTSTFGAEGVPKLPK